MRMLESLLSRFKPCNNCDFEGRHFRTNIQWRGQNSYLHILFDPAAPDVQEKVIDPLRLPADLREFYRGCNGAHLFADSLSLYGFFPAIYQFDRGNWRKPFPYNIIQTNHEYIRDLIASDIFIFGSYGFDRSEVFINKTTGIVSCSIGDDLTSLRLQWPSFEVWLKEEIARMCDFFDEDGNQLVEQEDMLPGLVN